MQRLVDRQNISPKGRSDEKEIGERKRRVGESWKKGKPGVAPGETPSKSLDKGTGGTGKKASRIPRHLT